MFTAEDVGKITARIGVALERKDLSPWQRQFLLDIRSKFERYGTRTRLTDKQLMKFAEIVGPAAPSPPTAPFKLPSYSSRSRYAHRYRKRGGLLYFLRGRNVLPGLLCIAIATVRGLYSTFDKFALTEATSYFTSRTVTGTGEPISRNEFDVTDGDTIQIHGEAQGLRLVSFNTPETNRAQCPKELEWGNRAKARLKDIVAKAKLELRRIPCACTPGTEGTEECNFGRSCGRLIADGIDVGDTLISEGLAVAFVCGAISCPSLPRPWCRS